MLKLIIKEPNQEARDFQLELKEYAIGRDEKNDINLNDSKATGKHALLIFRERTFFIKPLNKEMPVLVNEKEIEGETELAQGDEIRIGDTKIEMEIKESDIEKLIEEMAGEGSLSETREQKTLSSLSDTRTLDARELIIPQTHSEEKNKGYLIFIRIQNILRKNRKLVTACILLVFTAYIVSVVMEERKSQAKRVQHEKVTNLGVPPGIEEKMADQAVAFLLKNADENMNDHKWAEAASKYRKLLEIEPEHQEAMEKLAKAEREQKNYDQLIMGVTRIQEKDYEKGMNILAGIPEESFYYMKAITEITFAAEEMKHHGTSEKKHRPRTRAEAERAKENAVIKQSLGLYAGGKIDSAIRSLGTISKTGKHLKARAVSLEKRIQRARSLFGKGLKAYKNNNPKKAMNEWNQVLRLDRAIAGTGGSHYSRLVYGYLAEEYYRRAKKDLSNGNFIGAGQNSSKVLLGNPGHGGALEIRRVLSKRAKKLYEEGYVLESVSPERALKKWKEIIATCAPSNEYYRKARARIAQYE